MKNYAELINELAREFRLSITQLAAKTGVAQPTLTGVVNGSTRKPSQDTIHKIEKALNIKIDDRDDDNLGWHKTGRDFILEDDSDNPINLITVYNNLNEWSQGMTGDGIIGTNIKKKNIFALKLQDDFSRDKLKPGDYIVCDPDEKINSGDVVAVRLKDGRNFIRVYKSLPRDIILLHNGELVEPIAILKDDIAQITKVVQEIKTL